MSLSYAVSVQPHFVKNNHHLTSSVFSDIVTLPSSLLCPVFSMEWTFSLSAIYNDNYYSVLASIAVLIIELLSNNHIPSYLLTYLLHLFILHSGNTIVFASALLAVFAAPRAGAAGISLNNALSVTSLLNWAVRNGAETESIMNSVERLAMHCIGVIIQLSMFIIGCLSFSTQSRIICSSNKLPIFSCWYHLYFDFLTRSPPLCADFYHQFLLSSRSPTFFPDLLAPVV